MKPVRVALAAATLVGAALGAVVATAPAASAADPICVLFTPPDGQGARPVCIP